ncbi:MAG: cellulase family glycosylhydrolase [Candidatus Omnitrophota bacterium]
MPVRIHPRNPKIFEFRGKPVVLLCATEHYGSVFNRPFRFERYLADAAEKAQTLTRLFLLFREFQGTHNPYSTCKPESTDYIAPFPRTGPGRALDGLPKFDLNQWNPEFFDRLHRFLALTGACGIIVEVVLLSNTYNDYVWSVNPLNSANNVNDVETIPWTDYMSRRHPKLFARQSAHVRKMVEELNCYDHVFFEICNEPGGAFTGPDAPKVAEVNDWQIAIAQLIRETEARLPHQHLIAGQEAFAYFHRLPETGAVQQLSDRSFQDFPIDIVNMHPLPNITYGGEVYNLGQFMSGELRLRELRRYCLDTYREGKPLNLDEDNCASRFRDYDGWTVHRKRAWTTLFCGAHYDMIDFSILPYLETGTDESRRNIRTWMKHLSEFIHSLDLESARPAPQVVRTAPDNVLASVLGTAHEFCIYLADEREWESPGYGQAILGELELELPPATYRAAFFTPTTGLYSPSLRLECPGVLRLDVPEFTHDLTLRLTRVEYVKV